MTIVVKDACRIVNINDEKIEDVALDFSTKGGVVMYVQNVTKSTLYNIEYVTNHPNLTVEGPTTLYSWHKAPLIVDWEPCDDDEYVIEVHSKMR